MLILRATTSAGQCLVALPVDTHIFSARRKELEQISWQSALVGDTMLLLAAALERLQKAWSTSESQLSQKMQEFQEMLTGVSEQFPVVGVILANVVFLFSCA